MNPLINLQLFFNRSKIKVFLSNYTFSEEATKSVILIIGVILFLNPWIKAYPTIEVMNSLVGPVGLRIWTPIPI